jgi:hypothetical protein
MMRLKFTYLTQLRSVDFFARSPEPPDATAMSRWQRLNDICLAIDRWPAVVW